MKYANLADIVNGLEFAQTWKFIRKGRNNWSLVGIRDEKVVHEVEHFHFRQIMGMLDIKEDQEIVTIQGVENALHRDPLVYVLQCVLHHLTDGEEGTDGRTKEETAKGVKGLLEMLIPPSQGSEDA